MRASGIWIDHQMMSLIWWLGHMISDTNFFRSYKSKLNDYVIHVKVRQHLKEVIASKTLEYHGTLLIYKFGTAKNFDTR